MKTQEARVPVGEADTVGATIAFPSRSAIPVGVLLAHGAGNDRFAPVLVGVQQGLAQRGVTCATFNFLYKERGRRLPDPLPVLEDTYRDVLRWFRQRYAERIPNWVIGGKSLGGRVASHLVAEGEEALGLVFLGYPLHPAGNPRQLRVEHWSGIAVPMLFVQGTRDPLCDLRTLERVLRDFGERNQAKFELVVIDGGDHSFIVPRSLGRTQEEVYEEIAQHVARWLHELSPGLRQT